MKRTHLVKLIEAVQTKVPLETVLIVGSQSAHALGSGEIPAVEASLEMDLLLVSGQFQYKALIQVEFGEESAYFRQNGFFVHPIGIGIVSLPSGWEARLQALRDESGRLVGHAVEIHDTLAAKIMAGREKDFDFLRQLLEWNLCDFGTFLERFLLLQSSPFANAVPDRLSRLEARLQVWGRGDLAQTVQSISRASRQSAQAHQQDGTSGAPPAGELREEPPAYGTAEALSS